MCEVRVCVACLATDVRMYSMSASSLLQPYQLLAGVQDWEGLPQTVCYECAALVSKFRVFRERCHRAYVTLRYLVMDHDKITLESIQQIDRRSKKPSLCSPYARCAVYSADYNPDTDERRDGRRRHKKEGRRWSQGSDVTPSVEHSADKDEATSIKSETEPTEDLPEVTRSDSDVEVHVTRPRNPDGGEWAEPEVKHERADFGDACGYIEESVTKVTPTVANKKITATPYDVQVDFTTSRFDAVHTLYTALVDDVCPLEPVADPLGMYDDSTSSDKFNLKNDDSFVRNEGGSPDPAAMVKQEMDVGLTMHAPDVECTSKRPGPKNDSQIKAHDLGQDETDITLRKTNAVKSKANGIQQHVCDICNKRFSSKAYLRRHISSNAHTDKKLRHTDKRENLCEVCSKTFTKKRYLKAHMIIHTSKKSSHTDERENLCEVCSKTFTKKSYLKTHMLIHTSVRPHRCDVCNKTFSTKRCLTIHTLTHTGEQPHRCDICNKSFSQKGNLQLHKLLHGVKSHQCDICSKTFFVKRGLARHMLRHSNVRLHELHSCDVCKKTLSGKRALKMHMLTHTGDRPHLCEICNKSFSVKKNLKLHMLSHTGERPHHCVVCNKYFSKKQNLKIHMLTHNDERHSCEICSKSFKKRNLKNHMLIHTGKKPHKCDVCDKTFLQKGQLKTHKLSHTGERPHLCDICSKAFSAKRYLHKHINKFHC